MPPSQPLDPTGVFDPRRLSDPLSHLFVGLPRQICADLASSDLGLFIPCANAAGGLGDNRDRLVPRPAAKSPADLAAFFFVGQLLGVAVRS